MPSLLEIALPAADRGPGPDASQFQQGFCHRAGVNHVSCDGLGAWHACSTHCQIGSVVTVGVLEQGVRNVQWSLLGRIAITWVFTVPVAAIASAMLFFMFQPLI